MNTLRFIWRALAIFGILLFAFLRWFVGWLLLVFLFAGEQRRQEWFARAVVAVFRSLGATFVKVGQIMSTRPDLFPPHVIHALETLQDNVGPFAWQHVQATFIADFGKPPEEI